MVDVTTKNRGFTLIELSIVLVIVGLLIGGVLVGRDLIEAARIRKVITELESYTVALVAFQTKYNCLAGDCATAIEFFGTGNACPTSAGATGTCNGNGDGYITSWHCDDLVNGCPPSGFGAGYTENHYTWQQLGLANMIGGQYEGIGHEAGGDGPGFVFKRIGQNVPASSYSPKIGYNILSATNFSDCTMGEVIRFPITFQIGSLMPVTTPGNCGHDFLWGAGFNGLVSHAIDTKMDDGLPGGGRILGRTPSGTGADGDCGGPCPIQCHVPDYPATPERYIYNENSGCVLYYNLKLW